MYKELYELIKAGERLDESFIHDVYDLLMDNNGDLEDYIKSLEVSTASNDGGNYYPDTRRININIERLNSINKPPYNNYNRRLMGAFSVEHEIEHAKLLKAALEGKEDIESTMAKYGYVDYLVKWGLAPNSSLRNKDPLLIGVDKSMLYDYNPVERIASIKAKRLIVNMYKNRKMDSDQLISRQLLHSSLSQGYEDNGCYLEAPTYLYLLRMGMLEEMLQLQERVKNQQYVLDTRIMNGLPITIYEKENELLRMVRLQRRRE